MNPDQYLLRHFLATIAYRTQKALREAPDSYSDFRAGVNVRTPHEIVWHMTGVLGYARTFFQPGIRQPERLGNFINEVERLHAVMEDLARLLGQGTPRNIFARPIAPGPAGRRHDACRPAQNTAPPGRIACGFREFHLRED